MGQTERQSEVKKVRVPPDADKHGQADSGYQSSAGPEAERRKL